MKTNIEPSGKMKVNPNSKRTSSLKKPANGPLSKRRGSANSHGTLSRNGMNAVSPDDSSIPGLPAVAERKVIAPDATISIVPMTEMTICELKKTANTFVDSVLNLCRRSLTSCGGNPVIEEPFLLFVRECGFVEAKCWAEAIHIPHTHSGALLSALMLGPRRRSPSFVAQTIKSTSAVPPIPKHAP